MFTTFDIRWDFLTQLCASVPGESDMVRKWLEARSPSVRPPQSKSLDEVAQEVIETITDEAEAETNAPPATLVFQRIPHDGHPAVLAVRLATIKAHLKDSAFQLQRFVSGAVIGESGLRVKVANGVYWPATPPTILFRGTPFVPIRVGDGYATAPTGVREVAIHVNTPQGQRSALKLFEYIENAAIDFRLSVLTAPDRKVKRGKELVAIAGRPLVNEQDLDALMMYGGHHGYAGERSLDGGRYVYKITRAGE